MELGLAEVVAEQGLAAVVAEQGVVEEAEEIGLRWDQVRHGLPKVYHVPRRDRLLRHQRLHDRRCRR